MEAAKFDLLKYIEDLTSVGVPREQANIQGKAIQSILKNDLVTKEDLKKDLQLLESKLIIKLGGMMIAGFVITIGILKYS